MKTYSFILILMISSTNILSQKEDYHWMFGIGSNLMNELYCGTTMDFNFDPPDLYYDYSPIKIDYANASISDVSGNLLFYTNGIGVYNSQHELIPGSDTLNPGEINDQFYYLGYPLTQGVLILPKPEQDSIFYIFHEKRLFASGGMTSSFVDGLY